MKFTKQISIIIVVTFLLAYFNLVNSARSVCTTIPQNTLVRLNMGVLQGALYQLDSTSSTESSYIFTGVQQFIYFGTLTFGGDLSITFYVNFNQFEQDSKIIDFGSDDGTQNIRIGNVGTTSTLEVAVHSASNVKSKQYNSAFTLSTWIHFVVIFDGTSDITVYKDGTLLTGSYVLNQHSDPVPNVARTGCYFGKSWNSADGYFNGLLDEIVFYNRILSSSELNCLYDQCNLYNCDTCVENDQTCGTCLGTRENPPICGCRAGEFENSSQVCEDCVYPCASCSDLSTCISCVDDVNRNAAPDCSCNSLSWDNSQVCELLVDITFEITASDSQIIFYNKDYHEKYHMTIEFSIDFTLGDGSRSLQEYLVVEIEGHNSSKYDVKFSQSTDNNLEYFITLELKTNMRRRKISVSFIDRDEFSDWLGNPLEDQVHETYILDFFYYSDDQRDQSDGLATFMQILIYICLIPAIPIFFLDRFWKISMALDQLQFIYLMGFINVRLPLNGIKAAEKIDLFRTFNFPNFVWTNTNERLPEYKYVWVDSEFIKNIEPILYIYCCSFLLHIVLRLVNLCASDDISKHIRKVLFNLFEYRFHIDYWQMTMTILAIFAYVKYKNFDDTYSAFFAIFVGLLLGITPIFSLYQIHAWREKSKDIPRNRVGQLMFPYNEYGDRKGYMYKNMWQFIDVHKKGAIYYLFFFLMRKLMYAFILVSMKSDLIIQISLIIGMNFTYIVMVIIRRPFKSLRDNIRLAFGESMNFFALIVLYVLEKDDSEDEDARFDQTWYLLMCYVTIIVFHGIFSMVELIVVLIIAIQGKEKMPVFEGDWKAAQAKKKVRQQNVRLIVIDEDGDDNEEAQEERKKKEINRRKSFIAGYSPNKKLPDELISPSKGKPQMAVVHSDAPRRKTFTAEQMSANLQKLNILSQNHQEQKEVDSLLRTVTARKQSVYVPSGKGKKNRVFAGNSEDMSLSGMGADSPFIASPDKSMLSSSPGTRITDRTQQDVLETKKQFLYNEELSDINQRSPAKSPAKSKKQFTEASPAKSPGNLLYPDYNTPNSKPLKKSHFEFN